MIRGPSSTQLHLRTECHSLLSKMPGKLCMLMPIIISSTYSAVMRGMSHILKSMVNILLNSMFKVLSLRVQGVCSEIMSRKDFFFKPNVKFAYT